MSKRIFALAMAVAICGSAVALPALADPTDFPDPGEELKTEELPDFTKEQAKKLLPNILGWVFGAFMVITALMLIVAGYMFVTGGGNPEAIGKAKNMLVYALVGLAIALAARGLMALVNAILTDTA